MRLVFVDGGTCLVPLEAFPQLQHVSPAQRQEWELIGHNRGIHWPAIDEDLSIPRLLETYAHPVARVVHTTAHPRTSGN